jgi:hypothetical protein
MGARSNIIAGMFYRRRAPDVVPWLEENIVLPKGFTVNSGPVRFSGREFMRSILELHHPESGVTDLSVSAGTQLLKTAGMLLGRAYRMKWCPAPTLIVVPSLDFARDFMFAQRLDPLIQANAVLRELMPSDSDSYKQLSMAMRGGTINLAGSNSSTNLSGRTVGDVLLDECCKFEHRSSKEAPESHPMLLADERCKEYGSLAFRYKSSSPNISTHPFWSSVEAGTQTVIEVECPHCRNWFHFEWLIKDDYKSVVWDPMAKNKEGRWDLDRVRATARYVCPHEGCPISSGDKPAMVRGCEERDLNPSASRKQRSFIIPSFYSPSVSFGDVAVKWLEREKDLFKSGTQNFTNSWMALPFTQVEVKVQEQDIRSLIRDYMRGTVPFIPSFFIITADPGTEVHWMCSAVNEAGVIAVVDWGTCVGIPAVDELRKTMAYQVGGTTKKIRPGGGYIDSKYESNEVFDMCARAGRFWSPVWGSDSRYGNWTSAAVSSHPGLRRIVFVDFSLKNELYEKRISKQEGAPILLPANTDDALIKQLSGQERDAITGLWKRIKDDHWGDCLKQVVLAQWIREAMVTAGVGLPQAA